MSVIPGHARSQWSRVPGGPLHQVHGKDRLIAPVFWLSLYSSRTAPRRATRKAAPCWESCLVSNVRISLAVFSACIRAPFVPISTLRREAVCSSEALHWERIQWPNSPFGLDQLMTSPARLEMCIWSCHSRPMVFSDCRSRQKMFLPPCFVVSPCVIFHPCWSSGKLR